MGSPEAVRRLDFPVKALVVVLAGSVIHWLLAMAIFSLMVPNPIPGQRAALSLAILGVAFVAFAALYLRSQYSTPSHTARSVPRFFALSPPVLLGLLLPAALPESVLSSSTSSVMVAALPVLACGWATALMVAMVVNRALRRLAVRVDPADPSVEVGTTAPPSLSRSFATIMMTGALAMVLLSIGMAAARFDGTLPVVELINTGTGVAVLVALAGAAGISLGQSPGQDVVSIARRLDAAGYAGQTGTLAAPVVVTSFDEVGQLLANLERLRARLSDEMKLYQQALDKTKEADALKSEFLSAVSHELRTPLNVVGGFAQLLLEGAPTPPTEAQAEDIRLIRAGGRQLLELINDILDMSMIESGELRLSFSATDVGEVVADVVQIHQPLVRDKDVSLESETADPLPAVVCDRRRLTQILTNLVSNAVKFTESGSIVLRTSYDARRRCVVIRCVDTGVGIAEDDLGTVFEEYRQVGSLKRRTKGTGLGLAIARRIAQAHGGSLSAESTVGEGSTFILELPIDPPSRPQTLQAAEASGRQPPHRPPCDV